MSSLVFTSLDRALEIDRLHRAIESSATWGEFRERIGAEEYGALFQNAFYTPGPDSPVEKDTDEDEREPADDATFSSENVPGYSDGDYPPWLAQEMGRYLPKEILDRYATRGQSSVNGSFYQIEPRHREEIAKDLVKLGYTVEERTDLQFW